MNKITVLALDKCDNWRNIDSTKHIIIHETDYQKSVVISPSRNEFFQSVHLFKIKIDWNMRGYKVITFGPENLLPFYSMFSDEVVIKENIDRNGAIYGDHFTSRNIPIAELPNCPEWRDNGMENWNRAKLEIADEEVAKTFGTWNCFVSLESHRKFKELQSKLKKSLLISELKMRSDCFQLIGNSGFSNLVGHTKKHEWQQDLLGEIGKNNYMGFQLLASHFLDWQYICVGGSAGLFSVVPVKAIYRSDDFIIKETADALTKAWYPNLKRLPIVETSHHENTVVTMKNCIGKFEEIRRYLKDLPKPIIEFK